MLECVPSQNDLVLYGSDLNIEVVGILEPFGVGHFIPDH